MKPYNGTKVTHKIQIISKLFKWLFELSFLVGCIVIPILLIIFWMNAPTPILATLPGFDLNISYMPNLSMGVNHLHPLYTDTKILGFIISLIPLTANLFVLYFLIRLFKTFERFEIFSIHSVHYIKYIGFTLLISQLLYPIQQALLSAAITWHNPLGERLMGFSLSQTNIGILLAAMFIILISWIMAEGYKIQEEQKYII